MDLARIIPVLRSFDELKAKEFYVEFLEFKIDWEHRFEADFPLYMQISKQGWVIHISEHHGDASPGSTIMLEMPNVEVFQKHLLTKKYKNSRPGCERTEWDTIEMTIADPFGNRLTFFENVPQPEKKK